MGAIAAPPVDPLRGNDNVDDFDSGATSSQNIGRLGWICGSSAPSQLTSEANHPGIYRITTTASSGTFAYIRNQVNNGGSVHLPSESFKATFIWRLNTNDANTTQRVGLGTVVSAAPTDGIYLEKLDADTAWFVNCRSGGVETRTTTGVNVDTAWHRLQIRRVNATTIGFTLDNGAEITIATNVPTAALHSMFQMVNSAAAAKTLDVDFWRYRIAGLVR